MMPLHNAIASARLILSLASESQTWSLVPQEETLKIKPEAEVIRILDCLDDLALHQLSNCRLNLKRIFQHEIGYGCCV
ncbi:hypothetical protein V6N13_081580 [Hibiscus sabdariffa]